MIEQISRISLNSVWSLRELTSYIIPLFALLISLLSLYYSILRGVKLRIAHVERVDFYPEFNSEGEYIGDFEVPIVVVNDGTKIGVLSDLHLIVIKPKEYCGRRIRTQEELEELPCTVKNQESLVFRIRARELLPIRPEVEYEIEIIGRASGKEIRSSFEFLLTKKDWKSLKSAKKYIKML